MEGFVFRLLLSLLAIVLFSSNQSQAFIIVFPPTTQKPRSSYGEDTAVFRRVST
jgi:hypothetical protein